MAHIDSFSHFTTGTIPAEAWDEAWFAIASWKGYLQSFPGLLTFQISGHATPEGDVRVHLATVWEYPEQLDEWRNSQWSADKLLRSLSRPVSDITEETFEDFS